MNKGTRGQKNQVERFWPRTSNHEFDRQERSIERTQRQLAKKFIRHELEILDEDLTSEYLGS